MDLGKIKQYKEALEEESISLNEIAEIDDAFERLLEHCAMTGEVLRDASYNAMAADKLDELEDHATTVEKVMYEWVKKNFGESEANNPSWSTHALAEEINKIPVILGAEDSKLGKLLGEE